MTKAGCNKELGFPIAQVNEVRPCIVLILCQDTDFVPLGQVWTVFQQVTVQQQLTQKFTAYDYCMSLKQHHTYREKAQCRQLDINTLVYTVSCMQQGCV